MNNFLNVQPRISSCGRFCLLISHKTNDKWWRACRFNKTKFCRNVGSRDCCQLPNHKQIICPAMYVHSCMFTWVSLALGSDSSQEQRWELDESCGYLLVSHRMWGRISRETFPFSCEDWLCELSELSQAEGCTLFLGNPHWPSSCCGKPFSKITGQPSAESHLWKRSGQW